MLKKYIINPISDYIFFHIARKFKQVFSKEPQEEVIVTEYILWNLLLEYRKKRNPEEYIEAMLFVKYLLIELNLRKKLSTHKDLIL